MGHREDRETLPPGWLPKWTLYAVLLLGPFGLLPIALSRRTDATTRLLVTLPMILASIPLIALVFIVLARVF